MQPAHLGQQREWQREPSECNVIPPIFGRFPALPGFSCLLGLVWELSSDITWSVLRCTYIPAVSECFFEPTPRSDCTCRIFRLSEKA